MTPEEILQEQGIKYTSKGKDLIISCLNPEHEDNNPSMHVDKTVGIGHCFSCGSTVNLFTRFNKILNTLSIKQQSILDIINELGNVRLTLPKNSINFDSDFRNITADTFKHFDVFTSNKEFEGRLVLPIKNYKHDIVAFIGRFQYSKLDPKYLVYPSGKSLPLFPPAIDLDSDTLIIVEGMFDLLNLYDKGLRNVITGFGLVKSNKKDKFNSKLHERFMPYKISGVTKIYILYDGDDAGIKAAKKLSSGLEDFINVDYIELPEGLDPGSMTQEQVNSLMELINEQKRIKET